MRIESVVLYGAGHRCEELVSILNGSGINVIAVVDADKEKIGKRIGDSSVVSKDHLVDYKGKRWCVTVLDWRVRLKIEMELIEKCGYKKSDRVMYDSLVYQCYRESIINCINSNNGKTEKNNTQVYDQTVIFGLMAGLVLGGIENRVKALVKALIGAGRRNVFILTSEQGQCFDVEECLREKIIRCNTIPLDRKKKVQNICCSLISRMPCTVITNQPDELMMAAYFLKEWKPGCIRIISIVSGLADYLIDEYMQYPLRSDIYIGVSEDIKRRLIEEGLPRDRVFSMKVPFPCDPVLERQYNIDSHKPLRIGYAGRLDGMEDSQKRMDLILKLLEELNKNNVDFLVEIAGDGPAKEEMQAFLYAEGIQDRVRFLGPLEKKMMMEFWKSQDLGINMADYEGRSISVVECMGGGAVPVVTDTSGVREDITDGENGYIVPIGDYRLAAKKICFLNDSRQLIPIMGRKAHDEVYPKSLMDPHVKFWTDVIGL